MLVLDKPKIKKNLIFAQIFNDVSKERIFER